MAKVNKVSEVEIDSDVVYAALNSVARLRKVFSDKGLGLSDLERFERKFDTLKAELTAQEEEARQKQVSIKENRSQALDFIKQLGLKPEDLVGRSSAAGSSTPSEKASYRIKDKDGNDKVIEASKRGRVPDELRDYLKSSGKKREDIEI